MQTSCRSRNNVSYCSLLVGQPRRQVSLFCRLFHHDRMYHSLAATVQVYRPDLEARMADIDPTEPITEDPPEGFFSRHVTDIADIGEPINPCFFVTGQTDPTNWYLSMRLSFSCTSKSAYSQTLIKVGV